MLLHHQLKEKKERGGKLRSPPPFACIIWRERGIEILISIFSISWREEDEQFISFKEGGSLSLFSISGNFIAPPFGLIESAFFSLSLSGFLFSCYWRDEERRARSLKGQHTQQRTPRRIIDMAAAIERYALTSFTESSTSSIGSTCVRLPFFFLFLSFVYFTISNRLPVVLLPSTQILIKGGDLSKCFCEESKLSGT